MLYFPDWSDVAAAETLDTAKQSIRHWLTVALTIGALIVSGAVSLALWIWAASMLAIGLDTAALVGSFGLIALILLPLVRH